MTDFAHLRIDVTDAGVRTITLDRPDRLNAVNTQLGEELPRALADAAADDATRVVVITGAGRGFCAGLDLAEPVDMGSTRALRLDPYRWVGRWVQSVVQCEKPVIAAINGVAAGAGFGLTLCCDLRLMSDAASCTAGYVRRGLSPDAGVTWFLPRLLGMSHAMDLVMTGRDVGADEALRLGLVNAVYPAATFAEAVQQYAAAMAAGPPIAMALSKRLLHASTNATLDAQLREELTHIKTCLGSADVKEALSAFLEKRRPVFRGA